MKARNAPGQIKSRLAADHQDIICNTPRCGRRKAPGQFGRCKRCEERNSRWGSYSGRELPRAYYANQWADADRFVRRFKTHAHIVACREWLEAWLRGAQAGEDVPGKKAVGRLADRGNIVATAHAALVEIIAVNWYLQGHPGSPLVFPLTMSHVFLKCFKGLPRGHTVRGQHTPEHRNYTGAPDRRAIAKELQKLNPMLVEANEWRVREEQLRNEMIRNPAGPFPNHCTRCAYNERKNREHQLQRDGAGGRLTKAGKVDGRTRAGLIAAGRHINPNLQFNMKKWKERENADG